MGLVSRKSFLNWFVNQYRSVTEYLSSCSSFTTSFSSAIVRGWYGRQRIATILGIPLYLARTYRKTSTDDLYGRVERHAEGMSASTSWHFEWLEDGPGRPPRLDLPTRLSSFRLSLSLSFFPSPTSIMFTIRSGVFFREMLLRCSNPDKFGTVRFVNDLGSL